MFEVVEVVAIVKDIVGHINSREQSLFYGVCLIMFNFYPSLPQG